MAEQFFVLPDDGLDRILDPLRAARRTIDIYVFTLSNTAMIAALGDAVGQGVAVRALVEPQPSNNVDAGRASAEALRRAGVETRPSPGYYPRLHAKSFVVDSSQALIASWNYLDDWTHTRDFGLLTMDPAVVAGVAGAFAVDWRSEPMAPPPLAPLVLSPQNSRTAVTRLITEARQSLLLEEEQMTDPAIMDLLAARSNAGVQVQIVTNGVQDKNLEPLARLQERAPAVQIRYSARLWLHAKLLLADGARMLVGSVNLTPESLDERREVSVLITDPAALARAAAVVQADFAVSALTPPGIIDQRLRPADSPSRSEHD